MKKQARKALEDQINTIRNNSKMTLNEKKKALGRLLSQARESSNHIAVSIVKKALDNPNTFKQEPQASRGR